MTAAPSIQRIGIKFSLEVTQGPDAGVSYQLIPPRISIGRDLDNHVVLTDPRVSRKAAEIEFTPDRIQVRNLSPRSHLFVNGVPSEQSDIKNEDILVVGSTEFKFHVETISMPPTVKASVEYAGDATRVLASPQRPKHRSQKASRFFFVLVFIVAGVGLLVALETRTPKAKSEKLTTSKDIENSIQKSAEAQAVAEKTRQFKSDEERTRYAEANRHFHEGFRDYQKGKWTRALKSFETARIIDPQHVLAKRYFVLADKARDQAISELLLQGKRYREKSMYKRCIAAFDKVLDEVRNKSDLRYREAEAFRKECETMDVGPFE